MSATEHTPAPNPAAPVDGWHWEDFTVGMQMSFGPSPVGREEVIRFAKDFDPQPFHLSEEAGKASLFGGLAASGWHTAGIVMRLMCDGFILNSSSLGSPGLDSLKWLKPVFPGDTLRLESQTLERRLMSKRPNLGLVRSEWRMFNQRGEQVLHMEGWGMFGRRDGGASAGAASAEPAA